MKLTYNGPFAISNTTVYLQNYSNLANLVSFESSVPIDSGRNRINYIHLGTNCTSNPGIYFSRLDLLKKKVLANLLTSDLGFYLFTEILLL